MSTQQQRKAAAILADLLGRGIRDGLPGLAWTVSEHGAGLTGRSHARPQQDRRAAVAAWALALGLEAGEHQHPGGTVTVIAHADRLVTDRGPCSVTVVADIDEDSADDDR